jgi:Tfp pilus assembly protein PilX
MNINKNKQVGMTLITSLMMLLVLTILGVTAIKISSVDLLIADNYQKKLSAYQAAESKIQKDVDFYWLYRWITTASNSPDGDSGTMVTTAKIVDLDRSYQCNPNNLATSIGPDSTPCKIFMFHVEAAMKSSGAKESHFQGAGKLTPNLSKGSFLD